MYRVCFFEEDLNPYEGFYWSYVKEEDIDFCYNMRGGGYQNGPYYDKNSILNNDNFRELYDERYYDYKDWYEGKISVKELFKRHDDRTKDEYERKKKLYEEFIAKSNKKE